MKKVPIVIAAFDEDGGIGKSGLIPWRSKEDMEFFKNMTTNCRKGMINACIMGRRTYESVRLPGRMTVLVGKGGYASVAEAVEACQDNDKVDKIFICGGSGIYAESRAYPAMLTLIKGKYNCDTYF